MSGHQHGHHHHGLHGHEADDAPPPPRFDAASWDERYLSRPSLWSGRPNPVLVTEAAELAPGHALDVGCGEGADALWLAQRGWHVIGVDVSRVALDRGAAHAQEAGVDGLVAWEQRDLLSWTPPVAAFDLVSVQFFHLLRADRPRVYDGLAAAVRPGGTFLVVAHHPSDLSTTVGRPPTEELFFTAEEIAGQLDPDEWEVLLAEARPRTATDPEGREVGIEDTVLKARRR